MWCYGELSFTLAATLSCKGGHSGFALPQQEPPHLFILGNAVGGSRPGPVLPSSEQLLMNIVVVVRADLIHLK